MSGIKRIIQVISPSGSIALVPKTNIDSIIKQFEYLGYEIQFANDYNTNNTGIKVEALHSAFLDKNVSAIICAWGGFHAIGLVDKIDYNIIKNNAKPLIGFSDITVLLNAIQKKAEIKTFYGPLFWSFNNEFGRNHSLKYFEKALDINNEEYEIRKSDCIIDYLDLKKESKRENNYWVIKGGTSEGILIGGHIPTFNLLQGSEYFPDLNGKIIMLEMNELDGQFSLDIFQRLLNSLTIQKDFDKIKGILIGAFHSSCNVTFDKLQLLFKEITTNLNIPVIANCNFGHTLPIATWPLGGNIKIEAGEMVKITVTKSF